MFISNSSSLYSSKKNDKTHLVLSNRFFGWLYFLLLLRSVDERLNAFQNHFPRLPVRRKPLLGSVRTRRRGPSNRRSRSRIVILILAAICTGRRSASLRVLIPYCSTRQILVPVTLVRSLVILCEYGNIKKCKTNEYSNINT